MRPSLKFFFQTVKRKESLEAASSAENDSKSIFDHEVGALDEQDQRQD